MCLSSEIWRHRTLPMVEGFGECRCAPMQLYRRSAAHRKVFHVKQLDYDGALLAIEKLTSTQRDALGAIACGQRAGAPSTIAALVRRGLVTESKRTLPGYPPVEITEYDTPIHTHMAWAAWCGENVPDDDI